MKDVKAWMKGILAEADDDTPRLAFADWLDEHGKHARAEFIRVQCELARIEGDDPRRPALDRREHELLAAHFEAWQKEEVPAWARPTGVPHRGFINHYAGGLLTFVAKGKSLLNRTPITSAFLSNAQERHLRELGGCPHLSVLRNVQLENSDPAGLRHVLDSPHATNLRSLRLYYLERSAGWASLAPLWGSPKLTSLKRLGFHSIALTEDDVARLLDLPAVRRLEQLELESFVADEAALNLIAGNRWLSNLRHLGLGGNRNVTPRTVRRIAESPHSGRLTHLDLSHCEMTAEAVAGLAAAGHLKNLTDLNLYLTGVDAAGLRKMIDSQHLPRLACVEVSFTPEIVQALGAKPRAWPEGRNYGAIWVKELRR